MNLTLNTTQAGDEYRVTLIALGPGLICCVVAAFIRGGIEPMPVVGSFVYACFLLVSLPGLPVTGRSAKTSIWQHWRRANCYGKYSEIISIPTILTR